MSQKNARRPLILLFLLSQILSTIAFTTPPTDNVSPLNITKTPTASSSTPLENLISQDENATSPNSPEKNIFDYRIVGTPLVLRITELGSLVTRNAVNRIIDAGIRRVVAKINTGFGPKPIEEGKFWVLSTDIDMRITALEGAKLNYFLLGK